MPPRWVYEAFYCVGAPWDMGPRTELGRLVLSGRLSPERLAPGRAIDLGCGTGANAVFLAEAGFHVTGVDFSRLAIAKARRRAREHGVTERTTFVRADLAADSVNGVEGSFDLLIDYCMLDDAHGARRLALAATAARLARPGALYLLWCFYDRSERLPLVSLKGPSRANPEGLTHGEEETLFGDAFAIERLPLPAVGTGAAAFLMRRR